MQASDSYDNYDIHVSESPKISNVRGGESIDLTMPLGMQASIFGACPKPG